MSSPAATARFDRRTALGGGAAILGLLAIPGLLSTARAQPRAREAELLMARRPGCPWCLAWDREIGPAYPHTDAGKRAPVRMIDITDLNRDYKDKLKMAVVFTPTFVLLHAGREIGRIEGYPGENFFWGLVEQLVARLPPPLNEP